MDEEIGNAELSRWLVRVEQKIDRLTGDHEERLRRLERAVWIMTGVGAAGVTSGVGALIQGILS